MAVILVATSVPLPEDSLGIGEYPLDRAGHLLLYGGLGWSAARATIRERPASALAPWGAWFAGLVFAALDEVHQGPIPGRSPSLGDWTADTAGLTLSILLVVFLASRREDREEGVPERRPG